MPGATVPNGPCENCGEHCRRVTTTQGTTYQHTGPHGVLSAWCASGTTKAVLADEEVES